VTDGTEAHAPVKVGRVYENVRRSTWRHTLQAAEDGRYGDYSKRKLRFQKETGIQWSLDMSLLQQWGLPAGGSPALQSLAQLSLTCDIFHDDAVGDGTIQLSANLAAYPTAQDGAEIGSVLGTISVINDWPVSQREFQQLTYSYTSPGGRLSVSIGQFPFSNFDGNEYLNNQQRAFVNYVFSQNGSSTYAAAGLGAYMQFSPTTELHFALGSQFPNDASAESLSSSGFSFSDRSWLVYAQWTSEITRLGPARYSVTGYESPAIGQQPASRGWSFSAAQDLGDTWALFGRANAASGSTLPIGASYALGLAVKDPLRRSPTDRIGLAVGYSEPGDLSGARGEKIVETYWNWTFFGGLLVTPDLQLILDPALDPGRDSAWVLSLRATLMF